jgi:multisubunit Na+/H+ antiporter MnhC subunit
MKTGTRKTRPFLVSLLRGAALTAVSIVFIGIVLLTGVGMVAVVARNGTSDAWGRWSSVGQAFGVLTAVISGFAVAALVVTFWMQLRELKAQRLELAQQRELLSEAKSALHKTAETGFRTVHIDLIKLAMADPTLAAVWPPLKPGLSEERTTQYLYANLLIQQTWHMLRSGAYTEAEMQGNLRYLFRNPLIREYWRISAESRSTVLVPDTAEFAWNRIADEICIEYENVLACAELRTATRLDGQSESAVAARQHSPSREPHKNAA